jgi:hypothetical protein
MFGKRLISLRSAFRVVPPKLAVLDCNMEASFGRRMKLGGEKWQRNLLN